MTDNLHLPQHFEGENALRSNPPNFNSEVNPQIPGIPGSAINTIDRVSLEALINVLLQRGACTEAELIAEENRLQALHRTMSDFNFTPVQIPNEHYSHRSHDPNPLRRWAAKHWWSRKLGTLLFGWKWHRKKKL